MKRRLGHILVGISGAVLALRLIARLSGVPEGSAVLSIQLIVASILVLAVGSVLLLTSSPDEHEG